MADMEKIYKEYFTIVNKYLFCLTHNRDLSEELTQETFYRAVKKIHTFRGNCKMSVWLCQIAKNLWYDELKRKNKYNVVQEQELCSIKAIENTEEEVLFSENKLTFYKKMQTLNEQTREVVYLRITGELSFKEIAQILNKTENWARITFYRGKQKLKEVE